ncbi:hypothetical protein RVR_5841 [Actinacidiphila reveromycinica]|uniref:Uncharacterized protein n=1 Tax=Actinacidiphila reveromycinica TaxID=659352 RepID=A0A7U3UVD1_9ACTN|nr:hypothetical protein [Streptomyces sp. SN-593]BBA99288.1 hypothetical protein RVR_5841 [Streptomyces sp. SN-593]
MSALKYGRLPGAVPVGIQSLPHYVAGALPKAPASVPPPVLAEWGMLGNDEFGDCGVAGIEHVFMAVAADVGATEKFPTDKQTVSYYLKYTGGQDSGVVLSDFLAYVRKHGYYGHKLAAFAPVGVHDVPTLQFALWAYDAVYCGITVTEQMMADFQAGRPWTMESLNSPVDGGHCVPIVGYDSQYLYIVTWGAIQKIAYSAWHHMSEEAWALILGEHANGDGHGLSLKALQADLDKVAK